MAIVDQPVKEDFTVTDVYSGFAPVIGLTLGDLNVKLYDGANTDVTSTITITMVELGVGSYRISYTPNAIGTWYLVVKHPSYFPWAKANSVEVLQENPDTIADILKRVLGLVQENYFLDMCSYNNNGCLTQGRIRLYSDAVSVGTDNNIIATYEVSAEYDKYKMISYKVIKI